MTTSWNRQALRFGPVVLLAIIFGAAGAARGQQPEPVPEPELESPDDADADDEADAGDVDNADDEQDLDEDVIVEESDVEWQDVPMDDEEEWADEVIADASDDAIATDPVLDQPGTEWQVTEFADDGDNLEAVPVQVTEGIREPGDMPTIRRVAERPRPAAGSDEDVPYSTGGKPVRDAGAPWQAQIYYPNTATQWADKLKKGIPLWQLQHYCGGTLIAPDWVLTAAHCIDDDMVKAGYRVRLGVQDISKDSGLSFKIDRIVRHSKYDLKKLPASPNMYANDIALIHIVEDGRPMPRDPARIKPIPLYERDIAAGSEVTGTGWGKTEAVEGHAPSAVLMKVDLRVMNTERCRQLPGYGPQKIHGNVICAAHPKRSTCQGDSGGAIILTNGAPTVVGVVSWGKKRCSGDGQPGAYTRVRNYLDWIRQAMQLDPTRSALP